MPSPNPNPNLKRERELRGWSQSYLAEQIGASDYYISRWENGKYAPSPHYQRKLCDVFGKTAEELGFLQQEGPSSLVPSSQSDEKAGSEHFPPVAELEINDKNGGGKYSNPSLLKPRQTRASALQYQNRVRILRRLRRSYSDLMNQSLQGAAWLELGLASVPDAVQNAANLLLRVSHRAEQHHPSGTPITQAYDEAEHELLILGEPGAGKSTLLLDLAQKLVMRAEQDETHPLPVILPLSSWAVKRLPLQDWIAEQLAQIYDVSRELSVKWVHERLILPLLDGLDEMEDPARPACIAAINAYHSKYLLPLVVCSRKTEYEAVASYQHLALQSAVVVQPLTPTQVECYLVQAGERLASLHSTLQKNPALQELVTTPLMLSVLILTYQGTRMHHLPDMQAQLQQQILTDYVKRMVERKGHAKRYSLAHTVSSLSWLARYMQDHNQTVFYLEHLQPDCLDARQQLTYGWWAVRLPGVFIGVLVNLLIMLFFFGLPPLWLPFQFGVLGGLLGGWVWSRPVKEGKFLTPGQKKQRHIGGKHMLASAFVGLLFAGGLGLNLHDSYTLGDWLHDGLIFGIVFGLSSLLLQYLLVLAPSPTAHVSPMENSPTRLWKRLLHLFQTVYGPRTLLLATGIGLSYGLVDGLKVGLSSGLNVGLSGGLIAGLTAGLVVGLSYPLISLARGTQMGDIHLTERLRWTARNLRRGLFNSRHLYITVWLTCISMIFVGLVYGLGLGLSFGLIDGLSIGLSIGLVDGSRAGLSIGLSGGLSYWFLFGLFQGIAQEQIEDQDRRVANQGIHRSVRNSVIMGSIGGGVIGIISILNSLLSAGLNLGLSDELRIGLIDVLSSQLIPGLLISICGGLLVCMVMGGLATLRHYVLRLLLWRTHTFPWQAPQFLDDATARILLRRVGGGYSFSHRLLLDYFADLDTCRRVVLDIPSVAPTASSTMLAASTSGTALQPSGTVARRKLLLTVVSGIAFVIGFNSIKFVIVPNTTMPAQYTSPSIFIQHRQEFVGNLAATTFDQMGHKYNVMVFNLEEKFEEHFNGIQFYRTVVYPLDGVTFGIWAFESGEFINKGDGGYINWAFIGFFTKDGGHVTFTDK